MSTESNNPAVAGRILDDRQRLVLEGRAIAALKERVVAESYMKIGDVMKRLNLSRSSVEAIPVEILPYSDYSATPGRQLRRYHPADVLAADALLRRWHRAKQQHRGEEFLSQLRAELDARDTAAHALRTQVGTAA